MPSYGKVYDLYWQGSFARFIRREPKTAAYAHAVALFLMTGPQKNIIGLFSTTPMAIAAITGIPPEGACKGLVRLSEGGFISWDEDEEMVWIRKHLRHEFRDRKGDFQALNERDLRISSVTRAAMDYTRMSIYDQFYSEYSKFFGKHLPEPGSTHKPLASPLQAPRKPTSSSTATAVEEEQKERGTFFLSKLENADPIPGRDIAIPYAHAIEKFKALVPCSKPPKGAPNEMRPDFKIIEKDGTERWCFIPEVHSDFLNLSPEGITKLQAFGEACFSGYEKCPAPTRARSKCVKVLENGYHLPANPIEREAVKAAYFNALPQLQKKAGARQFKQKWTPEFDKLVDRNLEEHDLDAILFAISHLDKSDYHMGRHRKFKGVQLSPRKVFRIDGKSSAIEIVLSQSGYKKRLEFGG